MAAALLLPLGFKLSIAQSPTISPLHLSIKGRSERPTMRRIRSDLDPEKPEKEPSVSDLKSALGLDTEDKALRSSFSPSQNAVDKTGGGKSGNRFMDNLEKASEDLSDLTEGDSYQIGALQLALSLFPIWVLYVLVAADFVHLPFRLPFLD